MNEAWASIVVAVIGLVGSGLALQFQKLKKENRNDHGLVIRAITEVQDDVREVGKKVDGHIDWHLKEKE
jgi:Ser-tRNA(Ala) deacylase AlaX